MTLTSMNMATLNALSHDEFVNRIGWVFEHSPWVAERAWQARPFATIDALHGAMTDQVERASRDQQLALLCAHPDLGTRMKISEASTSEQAGAGLDRLTPQAFALLQHLNAAYRDKFGFPFIFAVKGSTTDDILQALEARSRNSPEQEIGEALGHVYRIARFRLAEIIQED